MYRIQWYPSLESEQESVTQIQATETSEDDFSSFVASEFSSEETSENNLEDVQVAADDVSSYLEKIIYEMDVDASLEVSHNRRNIIIQIGDGPTWSCYRLSR